LTDCRTSSSTCHGPQQRVIQVTRARCRRSRTTCHSRPSAPPVIPGEAREGAPREGEPGASIGRAFPEITIAGAVSHRQRPACYTTWIPFPRRTLIASFSPGMTTVLKQFPFLSMAGPPVRAQRGWIGKYNTPAIQPPRVYAAKDCQPHLDSPLLIPSLSRDAGHDKGIMLLLLTNKQKAEITCASTMIGMPI
jgi:hypothetical protein